MEQNVLELKCSAEKQDHPIYHIGALGYIVMRRGGIIWHGINWEQQMRSMMEVFVFLIMLNLKHLKEGEDAVQFANRVRSAIAHQGGLTELPW